jgi:hypothetical protein
MQEHTTNGNKPWGMWYSGASAGTIDIDNDGVMGPAAIGYIDVSKMLSERLGRQMSQMMIYEIDYIRIELLNVDDANDNDTGASFSGFLQYHSPTTNKIKALKLAQKVEHMNESDHVDDNSLYLATSNKYNGLRFGWIGDNQVSFQTHEGYANLPGAEWNMYNIFNAYDASHPPAGTLKDNYIGRGCAIPDDIGFSMSYQNNLNSIADLDNNYSPLSTPYELNNAKIDCLGGLMCLYISHSSVDDGAQTLIDDDYEVRITVGVKGWRKI